MSSVSLQLLQILAVDFFPWPLRNVTTMVASYSDDEWFFESICTVPNHYDNTVLFNETRDLSKYLGSPRTSWSFLKCKSRSSFHGFFAKTMFLLLISHHLWYFLGLSPWGSKGLRWSGSLGRISCSQLFPPPTSFQLQVHFSRPRGDFTSSVHSFLECCEAFLFFDSEMKVKRYSIAS